jgi:hypothetical protein
LADLGIDLLDEDMGNSNSAVAAADSARRSAAGRCSGTVHKKHSLEIAQSKSSTLSVNSTLQIMSYR